MTKWTERAGNDREAMVENWTGEQQKETERHCDQNP